MLSRLSGKEIDSNSSSCEKAFSPIETRCSGKTIVFSPLQKAKAELPMLLTDEGIVMLSNLGHCQKA